MNGENHSLSVEPAPINQNAGLWILLAVLFVFSIFLFFRGLLDPDEGRYTEIPREMVSSGNWLEMRLMGFRYYEKPPLTYWITAIPIQLLGAKDWAARIPLLPAGLAVALLGWLLARKAWGREAGMTALLPAMTSFGLLFSMAMLIPDSYLTLWFAVTCALLYTAFADETGEGKRGASLLGAAVFVFLGTMTKGLVAAILPAAIVFIWLLWERRLRSLWSFALLPAAFLFLALTGITTWLLEKHNPGFARYFFLEEHLSRFVGTRRDQGHPEAFWFFFAVVPLLLVPWTLFLFRTVRTMAARKILAGDRLSRFLLVWAVVVIGFFSASTGKLMSYVVPAMLPVGLLVGRWGVAEPLDGSRIDRRLWLFGYALLPLCSMLLVIVWVLSYLGFFPGTLAKPHAISLLPLLPAAVIALVLLTKGFPSLAGAGTLLAAFYIGLAFLVSPLAGTDMNTRLHKNSSIVFKKLADELRPGDRVVMMYRYHPAVAFYTQQIPILYRTLNEMRFGVEREPERAGYMDHRDLLNAAMAGGGRWLAVVEQDDLREFTEDGFSENCPVLAENIKLRIVELQAGQSAP